MDQESREEEKNIEMDYQDLPLPAEEEAMSSVDLNADDVGDCDESDGGDVDVDTAIDVDLEHIDEIDDDDLVDEVSEEAESEADDQDENAQDEEQSEVVDEFAHVSRQQVIEALIFSSDSPLGAVKLSQVVGGITPGDVCGIIDSLNEKYQQIECSFRIEKIAGGFQMMTLPEYSTFLQRLYKIRSDGKLSGAALETLAVVAYKQPVLRAEVEAIRGVSCGEMMRQLMEREMVKIVGRAEELGRPMLYGTTTKFLEVFGLSDLADLPKVPELLPPTPKHEQADVSTEVEVETDEVVDESKEQSESLVDQPQVAADAPGDADNVDVDPNAADIAAGIADDQINEVFEDIKDQIKVDFGDKLAVESDAQIEAPSDADVEPDSDEGDDNGDNNTDNDVMSVE